MKFRYLVGFAALALLASCSKQEVQDEKAWVYDETLPVPLTFSMPKVVVQPTKAMIEGESMDGEKVGIFALANGSGDWTASGDLVMLYNQAGTVTTSGDGNAGTLNFTSTEYYPMTNDLNFAFYGYYPTDGTIKSNGSLISVTYDLGQRDVLWTKSVAEAVDGVDGFNARYVRHIEQKYASEPDQLKAHLPYLNFKHMLTALKFTIVAEDESVGDVSLHRIWLEDEPLKATLCVANKNDGESEGTIVAQDENGEAKKGIIYVTKQKQYPYDGTTTDLEYEVTTTPTDAGNLVVFPSGTSGYKLVLQLKWGNDYENISGTLSDADYKAGTVYSYRLVVKGRQDIEPIPVTLEAWNDGFGTGQEDLAIGE